MSIPKFHETFSPILDILKDGEPLQHRQLIERVIKKHYAHLSPDELEVKIKSGDLLIRNRIAWGKTYLKKAGFIEYPSRGMVVITERGKQAAQKQVTLADLQAIPEFQQFYTPERPESVDTDDMQGSPEDLIESGHKSIEKQVKDEILDRLKEINPYSFERVVLLLFQRMGYGSFTQTKKTKDGGIDGIINEDTLGLEKVYVQAKRYSSNEIQETHIRDFIGAMSGDTRKGIFVTTSTFHEKAIKKANEAHHSIILIDGKFLAHLMYEYGVGVQDRHTYTIKKVDEDFFNDYA